MLSAAPPTTCSGWRATWSAPRTPRACSTSTTRRRCCRSRPTARSSGWRGLLSISELTRRLRQALRPVTPRDVIDFMVATPANRSIDPQLPAGGARERARGARHADDRGLGDAEPDLARVPAHARRPRLRARPERGASSGSSSARTCRAASRSARCCRTRRSTSCASAASSSAPTTPRACSTSSSTRIGQSDDARAARNGSATVAGNESARTTQRRSILSLVGDPALGVRLRDLPQGLSQRDHAGAGRRAADPARRHAALAGALHERGGRRTWSGSPTRSRATRCAVPAGCDADLQYGRIDEILATGLHAYLTQFLERVNDLGAGISRDFLVPASQPARLPEAANSPRTVPRRRASDCRIHVALNHVTHYRYDRPVDLAPQVVRLRPAPHCRTPILSYSLRIEPAGTSSTGSRIRSATTWRGWCSPSRSTEFQRRGRPGRRDGGLQPVRLLPRAERRAVSVRLRRRAAARSCSRSCVAEPLDAALRELSRQHRPHASGAPSTSWSTSNQRLQQRHRLPDPHGARRADAGADARNSQRARAATPPGCWCSCCATSAWPRASSPAT